MKEKSVFQNLHLITELGLAVAIPIIVAVLIGAYLDRRFNLRGICTFIFLVFGLSGGFLGAYRLIKKSARLEKEDEQIKDKDNH